GFSIPVNEIMEQVTEWSNTAVNDQLNFASITDIVNDEDTEQSIEDAIYLTEYFWDSISIRDYVNAYSLLGSQLQQSTSYTDFRNRYIHIVDLSYTELNSDILDNNQIKTTVQVMMENREDRDEEADESNQQRSFEFTFAYENDQLKIINMTETTN